MKEQVVGYSQSEGTFSPPQKNIQTHIHTDGQVFN